MTDLFTTGENLLNQNSPAGQPPFSNQIAGYLLGGAAPGIAGPGVGVAGQLGSAATIPAQLQEDITGQAQGAGYSLAGALLGYQSNQLQQQGLATQAATAAEQQGIEQQQYGGQLAQLGLQQQGTQLQQANLAYQTPIQYQQQGSKAAMSGATNSQGNKQAMGQIQQGAAYQGSQLQLQAQNEAVQAQLAQLGQQSEQVGYAGQQAGMGNQYQQLQLAAKQAGIPVQQAYSQLQSGIGQSGNAAGQNLDQLLTQASQGNAQQQAAAQAMISASATSTGLGPNFLSTLQ